MEWIGGKGVPLAKIPHYESNGINGLLIRFPSIDLWRVTGHLQIPFRDTWWTWAQCAKNLMERKFWILSTPASVFGHGKYGNANRIPTIHGFPSLSLIFFIALSPTEQNPSFRKHRRRRASGIFSTIKNSYKASNSFHLFEWCLTSVWVKINDQFK